MDEIVTNIKFQISQIDIRYFERGERDFAYELYHKIRLNITLPCNVEITPESTKRRFDIRDDIFQMANIRRYFFSETRQEYHYIFRFPDLIIHEYNNRNNQLIAIEIKRNASSQAILKDLAKLIIYCRGRLKYKKGVLILFDTRQNRVEIESVRNLLIEYPEIEIWYYQYNNPLIVYCSTNLP